MRTKKMLVDLTQEDDGTITDKSKEMPWTINDEAIHRAVNYADKNLPIMFELRQDEGMTLHAILKNAYQEGFLHGFEHKFDEHNYEEK